MQDRRETIMQGALSAFLEFGYAATTLAQIRTRSGASTGSIYHFFSGKAAMAEALLQQAVQGWSSLATPADDSAEAVIRASVTGLLHWGMAQPQLFRLMEELRARPGFGADFAGINQMLTDGQTRAAAVYAAWAAAGQVRPLPWPVAYALMLGPAYSYLRMPAPADDPAIAPLLATAAWQAVRT